MSTGIYNGHTFVTMDGMPNTTGEAYTAASLPIFIPLGTNNQILVADSSMGTGVRWANPELEKSHCPYCGSTSPDDMRGNCMACGAPR